MSQSEQDRNDELVRRRLIQKMEKLSSLLSWTQPPTLEEVATYYAANAAQFQTPAALTNCGWIISSGLESLSCRECISLPNPLRMYKESKQC